MTLPHQVGLLIDYLIPSMKPIVSLRFLSNVYPHSLIVEWIWFSKINYVEFNCFSFKVRSMLNREVKPLMVASSIGVNPHIQIVLPFRAFEDYIEIARFELRVKNEVLLKIYYLRVHSHEFTLRLSFMGGPDYVINHPHIWREFVLIWRLSILSFLICKELMDFNGVLWPDSQVNRFICFSCEWIGRYLKGFIIIIERNWSSCLGLLRFPSQSHIRYHSYSRGD